MVHKFDKILLAISPVALMYATAPAFAESGVADEEQGSSTSSDGMLDIVVTAERTKTNLQRTAIAISAVTAEQIRVQGLQNLNELAGRVPGLYSPALRGTPNTGSFFIRGIGESSAVNAQAVSVYLDDVYLSRPQGGGLDLLDIEQVEVLRGPQGTLYGRNSSAGSIVVRTRKPGNDFRFAAQAEIGNYGQKIVRAAISGPIIKDILAVGISVLHNRRDGFYYNAYRNENEGAIEDDLFYAKVRLTPTDNTEFLLSIDHDWNYSDALQQQPQPGLPAPFFQIPGGYQPYVVYNGHETYNRYKGGGVSLVSSWKPGDGHELKSIASVRWFHQPGLYDPDGTPQDRIRAASDFKSTVYAEELQWLYSEGKWKSLVGAFFSHERFDQMRSTHAGGFVGFPKPTSTSVEEITSFAAYAQVSYQLTSAATITLGGRLISDRHKFTDTVLSNDVLRFTVSPEPKTNTAFTPKIVLDYQWSPTIFSYASISEGLRAGGYDNSATTIQAATTGFSPERVRAYEIGLKSTLFNNSFRNNIAVYYNDYTNLQSSLLVPNTAIQVRTNVGSAYTRGIELENTIAPGGGLNWTNTVSYNQTRIQKFDGSPKRIGNRLPFAAEWQFSSWLSFNTDIQDHGNIRVGVGYQYRSNFYSDLDNLAATKTPSASNWDGNITYTTPDGRLSGAFIVSNITNKVNIDTVNYVGPPIAYATYILGNPRTWRFRLTYNY